MNTLIPQWVAWHAKRRPEAPAIRCRETTLCWRDLDARATQLANALLEAGVCRGDRVGIFMDKSEDAAVAMYGIMRAGAAYVPLDPAAPVSRLCAIIDDCEIAVIASRPEKRRTLSAVLKSTKRLQTVLGLPAGALDSVECVSNEAMTALPVTLSRAVKVLESDLAYIIYTSGSTGIPKGIMHTHHSGLAFAHWAAEEYGLSGDDRLSNHAPLHFDLSILDYFSAAIVGACTVIIPEEYTRLPASYSQLIADERISVLYTVPFALIQLLQRGILEQRDLRSLRWVIFGGEPYPVKHLRGLMDCLPWARFDNIYGPAEVNGCTHYTVPPDFPADGKLPIGPIASIAECKVVDDDGLDAEEGELLVRTPTMMLGYWRRPDLNSRVFLSCQVNEIEHRYFRTGDRVERTADGLLYFCGRKDRQVKVRGFRIELDEVEQAMTSLDGVEESAAFAIPDSEGSNLIAGVILPAPGARIRAPDALAQLKTLLPHYGVPARIEVTSELPRTSTGKIDRNRLAQMAREDV